MIIIRAYYPTSQKCDTNKGDGSLTIEGCRLVSQSVRVALQGGNSREWRVGPIKERMFPLY